MALRFTLRHLLPSLLLYVALLAAAVLVDYGLHRLHLAWVGRYCGVIGSVLLLTSFVYSLRKRKLIKAGSPKALLQSHETLGWIGALVLLVHGGVHFHALIPWLAVLSMLVVVASGLTGKLLLQDTRVSLRNREEELKLAGLSSDEIERELLSHSLLVDTMKQWRKVHMPLTMVFLALSCFTSRSRCFSGAGEMKTTWGSLAVTLFLGAIVILLAPYRALTPGTLREGHLAQRNDCFSCHTLFAGAPADKCSSCHRPGEIGLRSVKGEALAKTKPMAQKIHLVAFPECSPCHTEHGGRLRPDATRRFSHDLLPAAIRTDCTACHAGQRPADALHAAVSSSCHQCHTTKGWKPASWNHERSFRFDRNHPARCADCHPPGTSLNEYTCTGCHEHALALMQREHREEGVTNLEKCRRCHPSADEEETVHEGGRGEGSGREEGDD